MLGGEQTKEFKTKALGRQAFQHEGQTIYEWDQNIEEVNIYIKPPDWVLPKNRDIIRQQLQPGQEVPTLDVKIEPQHIKVGIKGNPPFLNAEVWEGVFEGHSTVDQLTQEELKKQMIRERFQEDYGGFDFSDCEFNGQAPDARKFMGGLNFK